MSVTCLRTTLFTFIYNEMFILDDIIMSPINGIMWLASKIEELSDNELSDAGKVKELLMELQLRFEMDEITEEEYMQKEDELLERLNKIQKS
ncbi:Gas vesicle protein G [Prosthecochloris sp. CIB 2401]|nr:Gas vesicle protein G [Prosthecochloris sp. CIB 2401]